MKGSRSLRSSLAFGAVLWTAGLLAFTHFATTLLMHRFPGIMPVAHGTGLSIIAFILIVAGASQVRRGMSPFNELRDRLSAVRDGRSPRVEGTYPSEVQPLVSDLNALLDHREKMVRRAQAKAGDLAHGLKTPLALLSQEAERARAERQPELADRIGQQVERMRRQIDYHLAHARAAASGTATGARSSIQDSVEGLVRTLQRLYADRGIAVDVHVPGDHSVRVQREDIDEMLGNILENAFKWARSRVVVESSRNESGVTITIHDDGPGLAPSMREAVLQRGVRADEALPGSGLGLAIVRDLAELYGGSISLDASSQAGLRALLHLPA